jgi:catechol 2,3-dioxygenase-like lactoylglutathione lyase family enzyme
VELPNSAETVNVRYMVDDVEAVVTFYTDHFGFTLLSSAAPAFADVIRGNLRLLLSGPKSSAGRRCRTPVSLVRAGGIEST